MSRPNFCSLRGGTFIIVLLVMFVILPSLALGLGQPTSGFNEVLGANVDSITVRDGAWTVRTSMAFSAGETIHVNVTSTMVDWIANAAGGGRLQLLLGDYRGDVFIGPNPFGEYAQTPARYLANMTLAGLQPDWYYLRIRIDDTLNVIEARVAIIVGSPVVPHSLETFTDDTFAQTSEVFTSGSTVWVRLVGDPGSDPNQWNIYDYQQNSVVGGPQASFSNFRRNGNVYTFSIDLSRFGPFTQAWFYTLEVSLANGAFANGKQIEVFDPTVAIAGANLAPARVFQGQVAVAMLGLHLSLNAGWSTQHGPAAFNLERLRFTRTGTPGANADLIGIRIYRDDNGNGVIDPGEPLLASRVTLGGLGSPTWVGTAGQTMVYLIPGQTLDLVAAYDISPTAVVGDAQGISLTAPADVGLQGTVSVTGPPLGSSNAQVAAATVTTVTNAGSAPGFVSFGQARVPMDRLTLWTNGANLNLASFTVVLAGGGNPADVAAVRLYRDDGDRIFNPNLDIPVSGPQAFQPSGTATFSGLSVNLGSAPTDLWVVYDIAASAGLGHVVGSSVTANTSMVVSQGWVLDEGFPLSSGLSVVQGPTLLIAWRDLLMGVPQVAQGRTNLPVLSLNLSTSVGNITLTALRADRGGSASDADVPMAKLWMDANHNGILDLGDTLLATQPFVGGSATFTGLNVSVQGGAYILVFIAVNISPSAVIGHTLRLSLANPSYATVAAPASVDGGPFPIDSSTSTVILAPNPPSALTLVGVDLVGQGLTLAMGQTRTALLRLTLTVNANTATVTDLRVDRLGTATDGDVPLVSLWRDSNGNGQLDVSSDTILGSRNFQVGVAVFSGLNLPVTAGTAVDLLLSVDLSPAATSGATVGLAVKSVDSLALSPPATVAATTFPLASGLAKVEVVYGGGNSGYVLLFVAVGVGMAALLALVVLLGRRGSTCRICRGPVAEGQEVCDRCLANEAPLRAGGRTPPPPGA